MTTQVPRGVVNKRLFDEHNKYSPEHTHTIADIHALTHEAKLHKLGAFNIVDLKCVVQIAKIYFEDGSE